MTVVGFTGTRDGMTQKQRELVLLVAVAIKASSQSNREFHHGDCIGSDELAHEIFRHRGFWMVVHPPKITRYRAYCAGDVVLPVDDYISRNHTIVDTCEVLVATPQTTAEQQCSGTWATIRYAKAEGRALIIIGPDGTLVPHSRRDDAEESRLV